MNDRELLRSYYQSGSEESFRELVQRHLGMVYSVALRQVRNPDWAEEAAHAVFIALARKAGSLSDRTILVGWLYRATHFAAGKLLRDEARRARHEKEAAMAHLNDRLTEQEDLSWTELAPVVFEMLDTLNRRDRDAILLRFIQNRTFAEVAANLGTTEAAAKMRTGRALEKLRDRLKKRGTNLMAAGLATGLPSTLTAPSDNLIESVAAAGIRPAAGPASAASLAGDVLNLLLWSKLKWAAAVLLLLIVGSGIGFTKIRTGLGISPRAEDIVLRNGWVVDQRNVRSDIHQGQQALFFDAQPGPGIAWVPGLNLSEGVIEVDVAAFTGHMGIAFWVQDSQQYSAVYFRPQNRPEDPVSGRRGVQYIAAPDYRWQRLRRDYPGIYENSAVLPASDSGAWFHVRLEVSPKQVRALVDNLPQPVLIVTNLLTANTTGSVGFFVGDGSPGVFANLKVKPNVK